MKPTKNSSGIASLVVTILFVSVIGYILFAKIFMLNEIIGPSMEPNITGFAISNRLAYEVRDPQRGDVIVFPHDGEYLVKRIIGLPGERVVIYGGRIFVNDKLLDEPYLPDGTITNGDGVFDVPKGMYFVCGDNRDVSYDSRYFIDPYVLKSDITARIFWDFDNFPGHAVFRFSENTTSTSDDVDP